MKTGPYPAFPTDLQPFLMAALSRADGTSMLRETVFENRFGTAAELKKWGRTSNAAGTLPGLTEWKPCGSFGACRDLRGGAA